MPLARSSIASTLLLLLLCYCSASATAQLPGGKPLIRNFTIAEYQGNSQNWAIRQGPDGLIHVGGGSSLLVYDGAQWRNIKTRHNERVRDLEIDDAGRIWIGSPSEFGYFERGSDGALVYHSISDNLPEEQRDFGETRYVERIGDTIYFNTHHRLFRWAGQALTTTDKWDGSFRLAFVAHGRYYVAVHNRIYDMTEFPTGEDAPEPEQRWRWPDKARITFLSEWDDDQLLLGTYDDGLYLLGDGQPQRFAPDVPLQAAWPYKAVRLADGGVIVTTIKAGIFHISGSGGLVNQVSTAHGLAVNSTLGAVVDHEGGLWLAQEGAIARVELGSSVRFYDGAFDVVNPRDLVEHEGRLLLGGDIGIGVLEQGADGIAKTRSLNAPIQESFDLLGTDAGLLVAGFNGVYLMRFDYDAGTTTVSQRLFEDTYSYDLFPSGSRPVVYVASETGLGTLLNDADGWRALPKVDGINERPDTVAEDPQGRVWVGSGNGRYHRLVWRDSETLELETTLGAEHGVPEGNAHVYRLGDRIIFGTTEGGHRLADANLGNGALRIEPDPLFGNEQLGEQRDVFRFFSPDERNIIAVIGGIGPTWYGQVDSEGQITWHGRQLRQLDHGFMAFFSEARGFLWFGRHPDLFRMTWPSADPSPAPPGRLNLRRVAFPERPSDARQTLLAGTYGAESVAPAPLSHSQDVLRFEYALASFSRADLNEYRARLVGYDTSWSKWTHETRRDYTGLSGGDYRFEVQARNVVGALSEFAGYSFEVRPPWHLSRTAWVLYIAMGFLLLWLAVVFGQRRRQQRLLETQQRLEQQVAERTAEVRDQARELREMNEAKSRFFSNVSHEFRTPLTLTRGPLEELASGRAGTLSDEARQFVGMALRNTETMQALVGQVLDMNRLEAGKMPISVTRDDFAELVQRVADGFVVHAREQQIELQLIGADLPLVADFDPEHMQKVISNLLSNALKFTPAGGSVTVVCDQVDDSIELVVSDTGPGIAADQQDRIFERYFQGDHEETDSNVSQPGTGIGLALVRELVELHQGVVELRSEPGSGATFTVRFPSELPELQTGPALPDDEPPPESALEATTESLTEANDDIPSVLIVDDNEELRAFLNMRLRSSYRVLEAPDGEAGLLAAREHLPDVIVTDVMMPRMNGLEMTAAIKTDPDIDFIPVLMLSARTTRRDTVAGLEQGADDYLNKPFDTAELAARVSGLIASRRKLRRRLDQAGPTEPAPTQSSFLQQANQVLQQNLSDSDFGPRDWAQLMHMDRTTLYRKLKAETDHSPEDYLREHRLQRAAELLQAKAGNVSQVAVAVGFNSISYFSKRFRERFNMTPASYGRSQ